MTDTEKTCRRVLLLLAAVAVLLLTLGGCATTGRPSEYKTLTLKVPVRAACPARPEYDKLKATRPRPLRESPMPASADERTARQAAQLGRFEAEGGWADRVESALDRCQLEDTLASDG